MKKFIFIVVIIFAGLNMSLDQVQAQERRRVDLDDLMIKGEIHNDDRLMILARQKNELKNFVKMRTSYKEEMLQELPVPVKKVY